jgi:aspartate kinase
MAGEHSVILAGHDEVLELTHTAQSRDIFAVGALNAAKFIVNKPAGLYNMVDLMLEKSAVTNLYVSNEEAMITLNAIPHSARIIADIFNSLADKHINVDMISQTTPVEGLVNISFTIPETDLNDAINAMSRFKKQSDSFRIDVFGGISKLTIEGSGMERQPGIAAKIFDVLAQDDIRIKLITTSETKISCVIDREQEETAMTLLRQAFNL